MRALAFAVRHINASNGRPVSEVELLGWIRSGTAPADQTEQPRVFIDETDTATLQDPVLSGSATYAELAALADRLLPEAHANLARSPPRLLIEIALHLQPPSQTS